jgi:ketosteroid isomerase-like protein
MTKTGQRVFSRQILLTASVALTVLFLVCEAYPQTPNKAGMDHNALPIIISQDVSRQLSKRAVERIKTQVAAACDSFSRATAAVNPNPEVINRVISEDATYADFDGTVRGRKEMLAFNSEMQSKGVYRNVRMVERSVIVLAKDTAVLTAEITAKGKDVAGREISGRYRAIHIFADKGGTWQMVAAKILKIS